MLGNTIQNVRKARGLTLSALAEAAGVHKSTLSRWERGKTTPFAHELTRVLDALGLSTEQRRACYQSIEAPRVLQIVNADPDAGGVPISSGEILRVLRIRGGVTQAEVARSVGVSQGLVAKWERGECSPSSEQLQNLCFALRATTEEIALLTTRSWRQFDDLPLDKDALNNIVRYLEYHDTTRERTGFYLALAARYQTLYRTDKISEVEANDIFGHYGAYESWRFNNHTSGRLIASPTMDSLRRSRGGLTLGQIDAIIANIDCYSQQGQAESIFALLSGIRHKAEKHQAWWLDYMGIAFEVGGNINRAMRYYAESVSRTRTEQDAGIRRLRMVSMLCRNGRFRDALRFLAPTPTSETRPNVTATNLLNHAWVLAGVGDWNDATAYYTQARVLMRPHNFDDVNELAANVARLIERR